MKSVTVNIPKQKKMKDHKIETSLYAVLSLKHNIIKQCVHAVDKFIVNYSCPKGLINGNVVVTSLIRFIHSFSGT